MFNKPFKVGETYRERCGVNLYQRLFPKFWQMSPMEFLRYYLKHREKMRKRFAKEYGIDYHIDVMGIWKREVEKAIKRGKIPPKQVREIYRPYGINLNYKGY